MKIRLTSLAAALLPLALTTACPPPAEGEGEGDVVGEGEGDVGEGEGDAGEGEGDAGEGEGDAGEGEGDVVGEGEGDVAGEGEGEGDGLPSDGCGAALALTPDGNGAVYPFSVDVDGRARDARVVLPSAYDPNHPYPVVFTFHGDQDCVTPGVDRPCDEALAGPISPNTFGIESSLRDEAIIVSLDAENLNLFESFFSWDTVTPPATNPDILAVRALHDRLNAELCTDTSRTFAVGFSGGGFFTHSLACFGEPLTAIAVFEGGFEDGSFGGAANTVDTGACVDAPLNTLVVAATSDTNVTPDYGERAAEVWRTAATCDATTSASALNAECVDFDGCAADVSLCKPADPNIQHSVWSPDGTQVLLEFLRRYF